MISCRVEAVAGCAFNPQSASFQEFKKLMWKPKQNFPKWDNLALQRPKRIVWSIRSFSQVYKSVWNYIVGMQSPNLRHCFLSMLWEMTLLALNDYQVSSWKQSCCHHDASLSFVTFIGCQSQEGRCYLPWACQRADTRGMRVEEEERRVACCGGYKSSFCSKYHKIHFKKFKWKVSFETSAVEMSSLSNIMELDGILRVVVVERLAN